MDWIRENTKLATIVGIFVVGALALGALFYASHAGYTASLDDFTSKSSKVTSMEKAALYPSVENVQTLDEKVTAFENEVSKLGGVLLKLQVPVKPITDTDFQAKLKQLIADSKTKSTGVMQLPKDFAFGFDAYTQSLPRSPETARELGDYLDAVNAVVSAALDSGVRSIDTLSRSELTIEKETPPAPKSVVIKKESTFGKKGKTTKKTVAPPKEIAKVVERRELKLSFTSDQKALQTLTNTLASASKMPYYTVLRVVRIENEKQEGPLRSSVASGGDTLISPTGGIAVAENSGPVTADGGAPAPTAKAEVLEVVKAGQADARAVLGGELLKVFFEIDLVRFVEPASQVN